MQAATCRAHLPTEPPRTSHAFARLRSPFLRNKRERALWRACQARLKPFDSTYVISLSKSHGKHVLSDPLLTGRFRTPQLAHGHGHGFERHVMCWRSDASVVERGCPRHQVVAARCSHKSIISWFLRAWHQDFEAQRTACRHAQAPRLVMDWIQGRP